MDKQSSSPASQLANIFSQFHRVLKRGSFHVEGLRQRQVQVLFYLMRHQGENGIRISTIADHMKITPPTATVLVRELEEKHQVVRYHDPEDGRSMRIRLTPQGIQSVRQGRLQMEQRFEGLTQHLGNENTETLIALLNQTLDYLTKSSLEEQEGDRI